MPVDPPLPEWTDEEGGRRISPQRTKTVILTMGSLVSLALTLMAWRHRLPVGLTEMLGVLAGAWGVWLTTEESLWNWPVNIAGSLLFADLFLHARLFGAMGMQILYAALGAVGWYWWLHGGKTHGPLSVSRATASTRLALALAVAIATPGLIVYLRHVHNASLLVTPWRLPSAWPHSIW